MNIKDFESVKKAKALAITQLLYYNEMMERYLFDKWLESRYENHSSSYADPYTEAQWQGWKARAEI